MSQSTNSSNQAGKHVTFQSKGETIVGRLFPAAFRIGASPAPAIAILGPMTFQKEQAPTQYAQRLAELGYTSLIFDTRFRGESGGEPRCYENPLAKGEDLTAALDFLAAQDDIDADRLAVVGVCMGSTHVLPVAADDPRVRAVATVTGHYRDHTADVIWLGSEEAVTERLERGKQALEKYNKTGEVDYVPVVDAQDVHVGMPGKLVWSWYQLWADLGLWENRYAVMSDAALMPFDSVSVAARLTKPFLMIHGDQSASPEAARRTFAVVPTSDKKFILDKNTRHLQYYDDPAVIDRSVVRIVDWFAQHLGLAV
jgi:fermentation-respiration switch protein FrsA (DUF1100 family)